ncbi:MAG: hypothetical protein KJ550_07575 [Proteobacteria bacterium]|nr:hypothetical protein [Desulfobacteraceae bacterium]MBU2521985.1 hypothetical protein [Pseudomonadota bacterium]MBU3980549.1 hypothetical protein [Pseudomonadota bacterium]MBU4013310.1 hypothetical protein [Pseudomonadota bacterium]MBU4066827.1 hypothetical protein [Pseudomonadota bacterium]
MQLNLKCAVENKAIKKDKKSERSPIDQLFQNKWLERGSLLIIQCNSVKIRGELLRKDWKMFSNNKINIWIVFCLLFVFSSCGYSFRGGGDLPKGIKSLSIKMLENRTSETGAENIFTNDLIYEITTQGRVVLTKEDSADGILSGVIQSMRIDAISHRDAYSSLERRAIVTLSLKLTDPTGKVIWSAKDIAESEDYIVASDKQATERNRQQAIITLSKRLAEKVYNRLTDNF